MKELKKTMTRGSIFSMVKRDMLLSIKGQGQGQRTRSSRGQLYALTTSIPKRGGNVSVKSLASLFYHTVGTLFLYIASF